jgi:hypothetical protein
LPVFERANIRLAFSFHDFYDWNGLIKQQLQAIAEE